MVLRLLSCSGVFKSTSLGLDPLACGDLGLGTHSYGVLESTRLDLDPLACGDIGIEPTHMVVLWPLDAIWSLACCSLVSMHIKPIWCCKLVVRSLYPYFGVLVLLW